jgi:hypothetical protein
MSPGPLDLGVSRPSEATNGRHIEVSALLDIEQPTHRNNGWSGLRPSDSPKSGCVEGASARRVAWSPSRATDTYNCRLVYPSRGRYVGGSLHRVSDPHTGREVDPSCAGRVETQEPRPARFCDLRERNICIRIRSTGQMVVGSS